MARSILGDIEREYLKSRNYYPPNQAGFREYGGVGGPAEGVNNPAETKHRLRNDVAFRLDEIIREVHKELEGVDLLMVTEGGQEWYEYETQMLPFAKGDIIELRDFLNRLIHRAESEYWDELEADMREALDELHTDLSYVKRYRGGELTIKNGVERENGEIIKPPELADERDELAKRRGALIRGLKIDGVVEVASYIRKQGGQTSIPKERTGNMYWRQIAGQFLDNELGLAERVDTTGKVYRLTGRGEAVATAWKRLKNVETVGTYADEQDMEWTEAAHILLTTNQANASDWPDALE